MGGSNGESLREVGARLIDNAKAYARAEADVAKQTALAYVRATRTGLVLVAAALLLVLAALPVLIAAIGMTIAIWIGPALGLLAGALLAILVAGVLGWLAVRSFAGIGDRLK